MSYPLKATDEERTLQKTTIDKLVGGLNALDRKDQLDPSEALRLENLLLKEGKLQQDTGYVAFANVVEGIPQTDYQFFKKSGVSELMLVTTVSVYRYDSGSNQWHFVKGTASTTLAAAAAAGATALEVVSSTGFLAGERVGLTLNSGKQHRTTVASIPDATHITLSVGIPAGEAAAIGNVIVRAVVLNGNLDNHVVPETIPSHDWFVFTNGVDTPRRFDGIDCVVIPNLGNVICRALRLYNKALFLLNTIEGGTAFPQRVRRSDIGNPENWTTGTAGFDDLYDVADFIMAGEVLGPYLIIYRERSIERGEFVGQGGVNYNFEPMVHGEGIITTLGVADMGDFHVILGNANIYEYRAGFDLDSVGDNVHPLIFGSGSNINKEFRRRSFTLFVEELNEIWFFLPSTTSETPDLLLRYNISEKNFAFRKFAHKFVGFGFFERQETLNWNNLVGDWAAQTWEWGSSAVGKEAPTAHLCAEVGGQVYDYEYVAATDAGTAISFVYETKDFIISDALLRLDTLEGFLRGANILVEYSQDEGQTWKSMGTVTNAVNKKFLLGKQDVMQRVRFRFSGSDPQFFLSYWEFYWKLEAPR